MTAAAPFIMWVGGKRRLLPVLRAAFPDRLGKGQGYTYVEPFVGGGAVLFDMLARYPALDQVVACDVNADLIAAYQILRDEPEQLISVLAAQQDAYNTLATMAEKRAFFLARRDRFNQMRFS